MDPRPEVRNSGVRTLFSVVVSQGGRLSAGQWRHVWWAMCFPLLRTVHHTSTTSNREEVCLPSPCPLQPHSPCRAALRWTTALFWWCGMARMHGWW